MQSMNVQHLPPRRISPLLWKICVLFQGFTNLRGVPTLCVGFPDKGNVLFPSIPPVLAAPSHLSWQYQVQTKVGLDV